MDEDKNNKEEAEFQDESQIPDQIFYPGTPKIIQWVIKYSGGLVKEEEQASYVLFGFAAAAIIVALFLFFGAIRSLSPTPSDQVINTIAGPEGER